TYYFAVVATDEQGRDSVPLKLDNYTFEYVPYDDWDGTVAERFTVGDGSAANPYLILNAEQLAYLAKYCSYGSGFETAGKFYKLAVDVNLNDVSASDWMKKDPQEWTVGTAINLNKVPFAGTFDGNGHVIKGLYIGENAGTYNGLFPGVSGAAVIKNLGIDDSYISAGGYSGFIAGQRYSDTTGSGVTIQNCYVGSNAKMEGEYAGGFLGGVLNKTTVKNSYSKATVTGTLGAGSFIGDLPYPDISVTLEGCYNDKETALVALTGAFTKVSYKNCYTLGASAEGLGTRTLEQMTGENAKLYMQNFNFEGLWSVVEDGTPALTLFVPVEEEPIVKWDGTAATGFAGGTGTETDPYLISTGEQLAYLVSTTDYNTTNGKYFELTDDIYLNDVSSEDWYQNAENHEWRFANSESTGAGFRGTLNGNGHIIYGLYINSGSYGWAGLFPILRGEIKNLGISKSYIYCTRDNNNVTVGAFAACTRGALPAKITNCFVDDTVQMAGYSLGGFVGTLNEGNGKLIIENCHSEAKLTQYQSGFKSPRQFVGDCHWPNNSIGNLEIKNSYAVGNFDLGPAPYTVGSDVYKPNFTNCYTTNAASTETTGVTVLTKAQMTGAQALINMKDLDFQNVWCAVDDKTPQLRFNDTDKQNATKWWKAWDGTVPDSVTFDGGDGSSAATAYEISTPEQLAYIVKNGSSKYFKLTDDIYLNDVSAPEWYNSKNVNVWNTTVGAKHFSGSVDGDGHTIYGLCIKGEDSGDAQHYFTGLIPCFIGGTISNIKISSSYVKSLRSAGGHGVLVGMIWRGRTIKNCVIDETVEFITGGNGSPLIGALNDDGDNHTTSVTVENCYVAAKMSALWGKPYAFFGVGIKPSGMIYSDTTSHLIVKNSYYSGKYDLANEVADAPVIYQGCYTTKVYDEENGETVPKGVTAASTLEAMLSNGLTDVLNVFPKLGNVNGAKDGNGKYDDIIDICDLVKLKKFILKPESGINICSADFNNDREINDRDFDALKRYILDNA
ncbi:MAG: dockerin type I repeat-containing protein, partial [Acutalibacteraceae bacterium]|nr:dockerin type I repeat-containing protein [Acutalibacteraceae bacterium]